MCSTCTALPRGDELEVAQALSALREGLPRCKVGGAQYVCSALATLSQRVQYRDPNSMYIILGAWKKTTFILGRKLPPPIYPNILHNIVVALGRKTPDDIYNKKINTKPPKS